MQEMLDYGFNQLGLNKIWLRVEVDNEKAIKSYKRMGYVEEGILRQDRLRKGENEYFKGRVYKYSERYDLLKSYLYLLLI
jgi:RimJ/RimL family protein N-acetyltransferase